MANENQRDFLDEVEDDIKQERLEKFWEENRNFIIGAIIATILATAALSYWRNWTYQQKLDATTAYYLRVQEGNLQTASDYAASASGDHAALSRLSAAGQLFGQGRIDEGVALLHEVQKDRSVNKIYRDMAALAEAARMMDTVDPADIEKKLLPLADRRSIWHLSAQEMLAVNAARAGDEEKALRILDDLMTQAALPGQMQERVKRLHALYTARLAEQNATLHN